MTPMESTVRRLVEGFSLVKDCDTVENGMLRIATPFQYGDGSNIDLFLAGDPAHTMTLSDMGQTIAYLLDLHFKPWASKRRQEAVANVCSTLHVRNEGGQLLAEVSGQDPAAFTDAVFRLGQACIRVAGLASTQRLRSVNAFRDDIEEFVAAADLPCEPAVRLVGRFGREVEIDFKTQGHTAASLVLALSTQNAAAAHGLCNEAFRKWYDLAEQSTRYTFLTAYDTNTDAFKDDDLARLRDFSTVLGFPAEADAIRQVMAA